MIIKINSSKILDWSHGHGACSAKFKTPAPVYERFDDEFDIWSVVVYYNNRQWFIKFLQENKPPHGNPQVVWIHWSYDCIDQAIKAAESLLPLDAISLDSKTVI